MSNNYFNNSVDLVAGTRARSSDVNNRMDSLEEGFDKLPSPHADSPTSKGFGEVFDIEEATGADNPVTASQVQTNDVSYAIDSGTVNSYAVTLTPTTAAYVPGMIVRFAALTANTGASVINVDGHGTKSIKYSNGSELGAGEISANGVACVMYDGTNFVLISPAVELTTRAETAAATAVAAAAGVTEYISTTTTLYIRTGGSDTNSGLANTDAGAWYSLAKAMDYLANKWIDPDVYVLIVVAAGTYTSLQPVEITHPCAHRILITGASSVLTFVGEGISVTGCNLGRLNSFTLTGSSSTNYNAFSVTNGSADLISVNFSTWQVGVYATAKSYISSTGDSLDDCTYGVWANDDSFISTDVDIDANSLAISYGVYATNASKINAGGITVTDTTGYAFRAEGYSFINADGATASVAGGTSYSPSGTNDASVAITRSVDGSWILI